MKKIVSISRFSRREIERKFTENRKISKTELSDILFKMKYFLPPEISILIVEGLPEEYRDFILGCPLPQTLTELRSSGNCRFKESFHHEINWLTISVLMHYEKLNSFINYEKEFEAQFLLGNYDKAVEIIDKIDNEICLSQWSLEKRLLIAEHDSNKQSKSDLTNLIKNNCEELVKLITSYQRTRFDYQLPTNKYDEIIEKFAAKQYDHGVANYFLFRLNTYNNPNILHPEIALFFESNLSIIDRYEILIQVAISLVCCQTPNKTFVDSLIPCIEKLEKVIKDNRLKNISIYSDLKNLTEVSEDLDEYYKIHELFHNGDFNACLRLAEQFLKIKPYMIDVVNLHVKSAIILNRPCPFIDGKDSFINRILLCLYNIYSKNKDYELSISGLNKIAKSIGSHIWCPGLIQVLDYELSLMGSSYDFHLHSILNTHAISPLLQLYIKEDSLTYKNNFFGNLAIFQNLMDRIASNEANTLISGEDCIFINLLILDYFIRSKKFEVAKHIVNKITNEKKYGKELCLPLIDLEITKSRIQILFYIKDFKSLAELICKSIISNSKYLNPLNNPEITSTLLNSIDFKIQESICTPIIAYLYRDRTNEIWIAFDNFMYCRNYTFPSQIFDKEEFDKDQLKYFLRFVCIRDIYDSSPFYNNPEELDDERIKILNYLCKVDPEKKDIYIKEISEIETNAQIKRGLKEVDESKIFVDTVGIWREIEYDVKERFYRGKQLLNLSREEVEYLFKMSNSVLLLFQPKGNEEGTIIKFDYSKDKYEEIISHPHYINFKETFLLIRDRFISSNEFGLDSYISMRIRHGTLLGQIRSIFERYNLITKKNASTNQYIENNYWLQKLSNTKTKSIISEKFNEFSNKIDSLSEQIKNSFLQIKTEGKNIDGLFDFKCDDKELIDLYEKKFYNLDSHKTFYEVAIECLWQRTESNLNIIREKFNTEYSKDILNSLENLMLSIEGIKKIDFVDTNELARDITTCKTDTTHVFEKIALWFRRSYSNSINEFDLSLVTSICLSIVNKIHPQTPILAPEISINCDCSFQGRYFAFFIDIMRNILDNVIVRSELREPELKVKLSIFQIEQHVEIKLENNVSESINLDVVNQRIATIQHRIDNKEKAILLKKEGGSGYIKISNILRNVLNRSNYVLQLEQIKSDRVFHSFISFELDGLLKLSNEDTSN